MSKNNSFKIDALGICALAIDAKQKEGTPAHAEAVRMLEDAKAIWRETLPSWRTLAIRIADEAQTCLDNAHWEVGFGSGDLKKTIRAVRAKQES